MPLILPGVISGGLFAFITSFDEVVVVLFVGSAGQKDPAVADVHRPARTDQPDHSGGRDDPCAVLDLPADDGRIAAAPVRTVARHHPELKLP